MGIFRFLAKMYLFSRGPFFMFPVDPDELPVSSENNSPRSVQKWQNWTKTVAPPQKIDPPQVPKFLVRDGTLFCRKYFFSLFLVIFSCHNSSSCVKMTIIFQKLVDYEWSYDPRDLPTPKKKHDHIQYTSHATKTGAKTGEWHILVGYCAIGRLRPRPSDRTVDW